MSARNLGRKRMDPRSAPEVSTIPRQLDLRVHDLDALNEIELYAEVLSAVAEERSRKKSRYPTGATTVIPGPA